MPWLSTSACSTSNIPSEPWPRPTACSARADEPPIRSGRLPTGPGPSRSSTAPSRDYGTLEVPLPPGPPFFRFSDPEESSRILLETGFQEPRIESLRLTWRVPSAPELLRAFEEGTARTGPTLLAQSPEDLARIRNAILERASAYGGDGGLEVPMVAVLCRGRKESGPCFADDS